jgi:hypothetical protein
MFEEELHERDTEHVLPIQRGRERLTRGESTGK